MRHQFTPKEIERFWKKVDRSGECWLWTACTRSTGYGQFMISRERDGVMRQTGYSAHRFSWELEFGPIPAGLCVCHRCDTPLCVNPAHLFLGTIAENNRDRSLKGRSSHRPVNQGESCARAKLTEAQVREIRARYAAGGCTTLSLAPEFGVTHQTIQKIVTRYLWRHVE